MHCWEGLLVELQSMRVRRCVDGRCARVMCCGCPCDAVLVGDWGWGCANWRKSLSCRSCSGHCPCEATPAISTRPTRQRRRHQAWRSSSNTSPPRSSCRSVQWSLRRRRRLQGVRRGAYVCPLVSRSWSGLVRALAPVSSDAILSHSLCSVCFYLCVPALLHCIVFNRCDVRVRCVCATAVANAALSDPCGNTAVTRAFRL